jgi:hypothetical protein
LTLRLEELTLNTVYENFIRQIAGVEKELEMLGMEGY